MDRDWVEVSVRTVACYVEAVTAALGVAGSSGAAVEEGSESIVRVYLPPGAETSGKLREMSRRLECLSASLGLSRGALSVRTRRVREQDWAEAWKRFFRPVVVGRIVVKPTWEQVDQQSAELVVEIDPGMAFGTGCHESTRLMLEAAQEVIVPGGRVIDVGCGSGILSIAAAKLGAAEVLGIDSDKWAASIARDNLERSGLAARWRIVAAEGLRGVRGEWDVILANVDAPTVARLAEAAQGLLRPRGWYIAGGFTMQRAATVRRELRGRFESVTTRALSDWRCVWAQARGS